MLRTCFHRLVAVVALLLVDASPLMAQTSLGSAITYQGQLKNAGSPSTGNFNMVFALWNDATLSAPANKIGPTLTFDGAGGNPPPVSVTNGLFTVSLDFGAASFNGDKRWLEISVNGSTLAPRQELAAAPYARFAAAPWTRNGTVINYTGGNVGIGTPTPAKPLHVQANVPGIGGIVTRIENTASNTGDGMEIKIGAGFPSEGVNRNWITFLADNNIRGSIEGNGNGSVQLGGSGSDYAEWLPADDPKETFEPGDVIGVIDGHISKSTAGASAVMAVSTGPIVVGNYLDDGNAPGARVAFVGQTPVKVRGPVKAGQFIIPDGEADGVGIAVDGAKIPLDQAAMVVGRAWDSSDNSGVKTVNCVVGLPTASGALVRLIAVMNEQAAQAHEHEQKLESLKEETAALKERLQRLERRLTARAD